jgi:hypothetical protein
MKDKRACKSDPFMNHGEAHAVNGISTVQEPQPSNDRQAEIIGLPSNGFCAMVNSARDTSRKFLT